MRLHLRKISNSPKYEIVDDDEFIWYFVTDINLAYNILKSHDCSDYEYINKSMILRKRNTARLVNKYLSDLLLKSKT